MQQSSVGNVVGVDEGDGVYVLETGVDVLYIIVEIGVGEVDVDTVLGAVNDGVEVSVVVCVYAVTVDVVCISVVVGVGELDIGVTICVMY